MPREESADSGAFAANPCQRLEVAHGISAATAIFRLQVNTEQVVLLRQRYDLIVELPFRVGQFLGWADFLTECFHIRGQLGGIEWHDRRLPIRFADILRGCRESEDGASSARRNR